MSIISEATRQPLTELEVQLRAEIARLREQLLPDMRDVLLFEAAEHGVKLELAMLREFYKAVTAPGVTLRVSHSYECRRGSLRGHKPCLCGGDARQARIDKARAALAEASEDNGGVTGA